MEERHVFIMSGSQTPFGVNERLSRISLVLPRRAPIVPSGITHSGSFLGGRHPKLAATQPSGVRTMAGR